MRNPISSHRTKHIALAHHHVRELVEQGIVVPAHKAGSDMCADMCTKGVKEVQLVMCRRLAGLSQLDLRPEVSMP